jgi:hypothetical protein
MATRDDLMTLARVGHQLLLAIRYASKTLPPFAIHCARSKSSWIRRGRTVGGIVSALKPPFLATSFSAGLTNG